MTSTKTLNFKLFLRVFGVFAILLTILPFIPVDNWSVRVFDFPHLQLTLLTLLALLTYFFRFEFRNRTDYIFAFTLLGCFVFQAIKIYPYTAFAKYEVQNSSPNISPTLSVYTANVLQDNENESGVLEDAQRYDADVLLFTETNGRWQSFLVEAFKKSHPFKIEVPLENTYGMLLYSKYELFGGSIEYMVEDTIPSIHSKLILPTNDTIQLYAIHPAPPTPQHNPSSVDRDAEMMKIAKMTRSVKDPVIVLGDFNDVAWSETTALFQRVSGLLDLRKGRGFFSTYNAKSWIMRWPLDHIFTSPELRVKDVQLGENTGSDHYPFFTELSLEPKLSDEQRLVEPTKEELKQAFEQIEKEAEDST